MTNEDAVARWKESAMDDWAVAESLFRDEKYSYCLFFCHLALEKLLKAIIIKNADQTPPITHNIVNLLNEAGLSYVKLTKNELDEISTFNVEARYDVYKRTLYKKATKEFTAMYLEKIKEFILWLGKQ